jgi:hypothetical protein
VHGEREHDKGVGRGDPSGRGAGFSNSIVERCELGESRASVASIQLLSLAWRSVWDYAC